MEKIWLEHYPKGVPAEIDVNEYASVREVFEESVAQFGERPSFTCMRSFGEVKEGNVVTLDFIDGATVVGFNGAPRGTIPGEPFNVALTKIWLGDKPVQADLKKALLGG